MRACDDDVDRQYLEILVKSKEYFVDGNGDVVLKRDGEDVMVMELQNRGDYNDN